MHYIKKYFYGLSLIACVFFILGCTPVECPKKGWLKDECVKVGEFPYADNKVLKIPNEEPKKYRWYGSLSYFKESQRIKSPNLGFYFKSGKAAGQKNEAWPIYSPDLILFNISYSSLKPKQELKDEPYVKDLINTYSTAPRLKGTPIDLIRYSKTSSPSERLIFLKEDHSVYTVCSSLKDLQMNRKGNCENYFYIEPGLLVVYTVFIDSIEDMEKIEPAQKALKALIESWM